MSPEGLMIVLVLGAMVVASFWRQLLLLLLFLFMAVFVLGVYHVVVILHHG